MNPAQNTEDRPLDPEKLLRLASLVRAITEEAKALDPASTPVTELAELHQRITKQLQEALPNSLREELQSLALAESFIDGASPAELRIAYSGLIGWLQGLFQGLSAAMQLQSMQQMGQIPAQKSEADEDQAEKDVKGRYL